MPLQLKTGHLAYTATNHLAFCTEDTCSECCSMITGFRITISGAANVSCSQCTNLNGTFDVPTTLSASGSCQGSLLIGVNCGLPANYNLAWQLTCNGDGTFDFVISLTTPGGSLLIRQTGSFDEATTGCCAIDLSGTDIHNGVSDIQCDFSAITFNSAVAYGGAC